MMIQFGVEIATDHPEQKTSSVNIMSSVNSEQLVCDHRSCLELSNQQQKKQQQYTHPIILPFTPQWAFIPNTPTISSSSIASRSSSSVSSNRLATITMDASWLEDGRSTSEIMDHRCTDLSSSVQNNNHHHYNQYPHNSSDIVAASSKSAFRRDHTSSVLYRALIMVLMVSCLTAEVATANEGLALGTSGDNRNRQYDQSPPLSQYYDELLNSGYIDSIKLNAIRWKMLEHLKNSRPTDQLIHRQKSRLTEPIFDPNLEELSIETFDAKEKLPKSSAKSLEKNMYYGKDGKLHSDHVKEEEAEDEIEDGTATEEPEWLENNKLALGDQHQFLKNVIKSGWIEHSSTKTLLYFLKKINYLLSIDGEHSSEPNLDLEAQDQTLNPEEDLLLETNKDHNDTGVEHTKAKQKESSFVQTHKNIEVVLDRLMSTPNVVKKRGEGPQLSIDSPLTVLRHRLIVELARREAEKTEKQIAINTEILKKLGRRRRRRSVPDSGHIISRIQPANDLRVQPRLTTTEDQTSGSVAKRNRFRNNDKLIMWDKVEEAEADHSSDHNRLTYHSQLDRARINSRKPVMAAGGNGELSSIGPDTSLVARWNLWQQLNSPLYRYLTLTMRHNGAKRS